MGDLKAFGRQEINDDTSVWLDMRTGKNSSKGHNYTDIQSISYFSDGRRLNATLWLTSLKELTRERPSDEWVYYGMLIDADAKNYTGYEGIDYQVQIKWNNKTQQWIREFNEFAFNGDFRSMTPVQSNYSGFYKKGGNFVNLYLDLNDIFFPSQYKIFFYAYAHENNSSPWLLDAVRWVYVPPPEFTLTTTPRLVNVTAGDEGNAEVQVTSKTGFAPKIKFYYDKSTSKDIQLEFGYPEITLPSYGIATNPLVVSAGNSTSGPKTIVLLANVSFPTQFFTSPIPGGNKTKLPIYSEDQKVQATILSSVEPPPDMSEQFRNWLTNWFNPITGTWTTLATIMTGILGWKVWKNRK